MARASTTANSLTYKYFLLTYPLPFVAKVEIYRPEKMNAFIQESVTTFLPSIFHRLLVHAFRTNAHQ